MADNNVTNKPQSPITSPPNTKAEAKTGPVPAKEPEVSTNRSVAGWLAEYSKRKLGRGVGFDVEPGLTLNPEFTLPGLPIPGVGVTVPGFTLPGVIGAHGLVGTHVRVGLKGTDGYAALVSSDKRRQDHARKTGELWVQGEGRLGYDWDVGLGLSKGARKEWDVRFIGAYAAGGSKGNLKDFGRDALRAFKLPKTGADLKAFNWAPGSELAMTEVNEKHTNFDVAGPVVGFARAKVGATKAKIVTDTKIMKHVGQERGDHVYFVQWGQFTENLKDKRVGVEAGIPLSVTLPGKPAPPPAPVDEGQVPVQGQATERRTISTGFIPLARVEAGRSESHTHRVVANGVFKFDGGEGETLFNTLNTKSVDEVAEYVKQNRKTLAGAAVAVVDGNKKKDRLTVELVGKKLLNVSNTRGDVDAVVFRPEGDTKIKEESVEADRQGFLYRFGNEGMKDGVRSRHVEVAVGTLERPGQKATTAMQVEVNVKLGSLSREQAVESERFVREMGAQVSLPDAKKLGNTEITFGAAWNEEELAKLITIARKNPHAVVEAIGYAKARIDGSSDLAMWVENPKAFEAYVAKYKDPLVDSDGKTGRELARKDYRDDTGRDLEKDLSSHETASAVAKALQNDVAPGDLKAMGKLLEAIGHQYSRDVRNVVLGLKDIAGGTLMRFDVKTEKAGAVSAKLQYTGQVQGRAEAEIGKLMAPPEPAVEAPSPG